jgi:hypothetical protein
MTLPAVAVEAERIPKDEKRGEHLKWVWYHFLEARYIEKSKSSDSSFSTSLPFSTDTTA